MTYDNSKQVVMSKVVSDKPNAPALSVSFEVNGQKYQAGLWPWTKKDGTPVKDKNGNQLYQGDWREDNWKPEQSAQPEQPAPAGGGGSIDDDIPFLPYMKGEF